MTFSFQKVQSKLSKYNFKCPWISENAETRIMTEKSLQEKKEEIWLSPMTKSPTPTEKSKKQRDNTKTPPKTSITQWLRTDLGWSVGETTATQLM